MKKNTVRALIGIVSILIVIGLTIPSSVFGGSKTKFSIGWTESPQAGMNPFLARNEGDFVFLTTMYEPMLIPLMTGEIIPWLAKSWKYNSKDDSWVFSIDERAKWSDGMPVIADDVKFTFDAAFAMNAPTFAPSKAYIGSVQVMDKRTVKFKMKSAYAAFLPIVGGYLIMPKHIWSKVGKVADYKNPNPVGSGPFLHKEYKARSHMLLVKNENYWKEPAKIDRLIIRVFTNTEAEVVALKKGDLDALPDISGNESLIPALLSDPNIKVLIDKWPHNLYLAPNYRKYPLNVKEFRKALDIAIDKRAIIKTALAGYAELPLMGYVPPLVTKWANTSVTWRGLEMKTEDRLADANAILDKLGFMKGDDGLRKLKNGKKLEFTIRTLSSSPSYIRTAQMIKDDFAKIGIGIKVLLSDPQTLYGSIIYSGKKVNEWDLLVHGSTMNPDPDHFAREYAPHDPSPWDNATAFGYSNKEVQSVLQDSRKEMDEAKRLALVLKAQRLFADDLAVITLGHRLHPAVHRTDKFTGWNPKMVNYGGMFHPLSSIVNLLSLQPK
jgi:peptide/nickel transport system substrate-binding protein